MPTVPPVLRSAPRALVATAPRRAVAWALVGAAFVAVALARAAYALAGLAPTTGTAAGLDVAVLVAVAAAVALATARTRVASPVRTLARLLAAAGVLAAAEWAAGMAGTGTVGGGVVRGLTAGGAGAALGIAEAAFVVVLVASLRPLVLFRRGRLTLGLWRTACGVAVLAALAWAGQPLDAPPGRMAFVLDTASVVFGIALVLRQRWVAALAGRQRLAAAALALALCAGLVGLLVLRADGGLVLEGEAALGDGLRVPASYVLSRSLGSLTTFAMGIGALYSLTAGLVLVFQLPAAEPTRAAERRAFQGLAGLGGSVLDRDALAEAIARGPVQAGLADTAWVALSDAGAGRLTLDVAAAEGLDPADAQAAVDLDALVRAAQDAPLVLGRAEADHRVRVRPGSGLGSLVVLPLVAARGGPPRGALVAARRTPDAFEADDVAALDAFAAQAALALDNAALVAGALQSERLARELVLAREVQLRLFPAELPCIAGLEIAAAERPALEVGGDYYDAIALSETCAGIVVADVSGKGTAAAFHMAELKGVFGIGARLTRAPAEFLVRASEALAPSLRRGTFISAAYAVVDAEAGTLAVARAGHCPPAIARDPAFPDGGARLIRGRGVALGLGSPALFARTLDEQTVHLRPGDAVALYTDGLVEARDAAGDEWGYPRLLGALARHRALPAPALLEALLAEHRAWSATPDAPADDVTVVVMKWTGADGPVGEG